jgi:hypothetical protein
MLPWPGCNITLYATLAIIAWINSAICFPPGQDHHHGEVNLPDPRQGDVPSVTCGECGHPGRSGESGL